MSKNNNKDGKPVKPEEVDFRSLPPAIRSTTKMSAKKQAEHQMDAVHNSVSSAYNDLRRSAPALRQYLIDFYLNKGRVLDNDYIHDVMNKGLLAPLKSMFKASERVRNDNPTWTVRKLRTILLRGAELTEEKRKQFDRLQKVIYNASYLDEKGRSKQMTEKYLQEWLGIKVPDFGKMSAKAIKERIDSIVFEKDRQESIQTLSEQLSDIENLLHSKKSLLVANEEQLKEANEDTKEGKEVAKQCKEEIESATAAIEELTAKIEAKRTALNELKGIKETTETTEEREQMF